VSSLRASVQLDSSVTDDQGTSFGTHEVVVEDGVGAWFLDDRGELKPSPTSYLDTSNDPGWTVAAWVKWRELRTGNYDRVLFACSGSLPLTTDDHGEGSKAHKLGTWTPPNEYSSHSVSTDAFEFVAITSSSADGPRSTWYAGGLDDATDPVQAVGEVAAAEGGWSEPLANCAWGRGSFSQSPGWLASGFVFNERLTDADVAHLYYETFPGGAIATTSVCDDANCALCRADDTATCRACADGFTLVAGSCVSTQCTDGVHNGDEIRTDFGGAGCPSPPTSQADGADCLDGTHCASGVCDDTVSYTCQAATCDDGVRNGVETDVDCGNAAGCGRCDLGASCDGDDDCISSMCDVGTATCTAAECAGRDERTLVPRGDVVMVNGALVTTDDSLCGEAVCAPVARVGSTTYYAVGNAHDARVAACLPAAPQLE